MDGLDLRIQGRREVHFQVDPEVSSLHSLVDNSVINISSFGNQEAEGKQKCSGHHDKAECALDWGHKLRL